MDPLTITSMALPLIQRGIQTTANYRNNRQMVAPEEIGAMTAMNPMTGAFATNDMTSLIPFYGAFHNMNKQRDYLRQQKDNQRNVLQGMTQYYNEPDQAYNHEGFYQMGKGGLVSPYKAKEILHDGTVYGHKLTGKQRRFFGAMSRKMQFGGEIKKKEKEYKQYYSRPYYKYEVDEGNKRLGPGGATNHLARKLGPNLIWTALTGGFGANAFAAQLPLLPMFNPKIIGEGQSLNERELSRIYWEKEKPVRETAMLMKAKKNPGKDKLKLVPKTLKYTDGGQVEGQNIEAEGGETLQYPNGNLGQIVGPRHEQGGVPMFAKHGTRIYSNRIKAPKNLVERLKNL